MAGMFQVQNYGKDFIDAFTGMANFVGGMEQRKFENERQLKADERADKTLKMQQDSNEATVAHTRKLNEAMERVAEREKGILQIGAIAAKPQNELTLSDVKTVAGLQSDTPWLTDSAKLEDIRKQREGLTQLEQAVHNSRSAAPGNYRISADDNPIAANILKTYTNMIPEADLEKVHVDADGSITGEAGKKYKLGNPSAIVMQSGDGNTARYVPYHSIRDEAGDTLVTERDDGTEEPILVPRTENKTNKASDPLKFNNADDLLTKIGYGQTVLTAAEKLASLSPDEYQKYLAGAMASRDPEYMKIVFKQAQENIQKNHEREINKAALENLTPEEITAAFGSETGLVSLAKKLGTTPETFLKMGESAKERSAALAAAAEKARLDRENRKEIATERNDTLKAISSAKTSSDVLAGKRDISIRLRDAQRSHQAALKTGDPDAINEAVGMIEDLNAMAKEYGVEPQPVPNRRFSSEETKIITEKAKQNLEAQRSKASRVVFGAALGPSKPAIDQEVRRLKLTLKPGNVSFDDTPAQPQQQPQRIVAPSQVQPQTPAQQEVRQQNRQQQLASPPAQSQPSSTVFSELPPAWKHPGRLIQDNATGKKLRSVKGQWVEER